MCATQSRDGGGIFSYLSCLEHVQLGIVRRAARLITALSSCGSFVLCYDLSSAANISLQARVNHDFELPLWVVAAWTQYLLRSSKHTENRTFDVWPSGWATWWAGQSKFKNLVRQYSSSRFSIRADINVYKLTRRNSLSSPSCCRSSWDSFMFWQYSLYSRSKWSLCKQQETKYKQLKTHSIDGTSRVYALSSSQLSLDSRAKRSENA